MVQLNRQYDRETNTGESIRVKVVGVGGAGSNILDRVMLDGIDGADMVAINTDVQSLTASVAAHKVQIGRNLTRGLGSGGDPELGYAAAEEATDEIRSVLQGGTVIFVCSGLGGGTGSGAAPYMAQLAKEENALVLGFVAVPFSFEGRRRCAQAEESLARLRSVCDAVVCFENDRMAEITLPRMGIHEAFAAADLTISQSIRSVTGILQRPGLLHIGFDDVCSVLRNGDARALFGYGEAEGENRAHDALAKALKNPLMNRGALLEETYHAIVHICGGSNVTLGEVQIIMEELNRHINEQTQLFMGVGIECRMGNRLSVSILSSLGNGAEKPAVQPMQRMIRADGPETKSPLPEIKPDPWQPAADPAPPNSVPKEKQHDVAPAERSSERASGELMLPPSETETPKPAPFRAQAAKGEAKPMMPTPAKTQPSAPAKKTEAKQETLQFEPVSRGRFEKSEPTIIDGQDLDVPTFLRKNVKVR
jgi:cell division protein FtsZ